MSTEGFGKLVFVTGTLSPKKKKKKNHKANRCETRKIWINILNVIIRFKIAIKIEFSFVNNIAYSISFLSTNFLDPKYQILSPTITPESDSWFKR